MDSHAKKANIATPKLMIPKKNKLCLVIVSLALSSVLICSSPCGKNRQIGCKHQLGRRAGIGALAAAPVCSLCTTISPPSSWDPLGRKQGSPAAAVS